MVVNEDGLVILSIEEYEDLIIQIEELKEELDFMYLMGREE
jgi:hypothetical protein